MTHAKEGTQAKTSLWFLLLTFALVAALALAGCGGGGGGGGAAVMPTPGGGGQGTGSGSGGMTGGGQQMPGTGGTGGGYDDAQNFVFGNFPKLMEEMEKAYTTYYGGGALVHSSRPGLTGVTVATEFENYSGIPDDVSLFLTRGIPTISRAGQNSVVLDSNHEWLGGAQFEFVTLGNSIYEVNLKKDELDFYEQWDRYGNEVHSMSLNNNIKTLGRVVYEWDTDDASDFLAFGVWIQHDSVSEEAFTGAFIYSPEFRSPPTMPNIGTAIYHGHAIGQYLAKYNNISQYGHINTNSILKADFSKKTISGCVGCSQGGGNFGNEIVFLTTGNRFDATAGIIKNYDYGEGLDLHVRFYLGETPFNNDGIFRSNNLTPVTKNGRVPLQSEELITNSGGGWAGMFSSRSINGSPRLTAGTYSGNFQTKPGLEVVFQGVFGAGIRPDINEADYKRVTETIFEVKDTSGGGSGQR